MQAGRRYEIESSDDEVQLSLMLDGVQVGGAVFPTECCHGAAVLAEQIGEAYCNNSEGVTVH